MAQYEFTQQYVRADADFYVEPRWCVERLLDTVRFNTTTNTIHDPACGSGTICKIAAERGFPVTAGDTTDRGFIIAEKMNYLSDTTYRENIITNPPFRITELFIKHGLKHTAGKFIVLARLAFLEGQGRYESLWTKSPPSQVLVLSRRASMPPGGQGIYAAGGKTAFCWIVWDLASPHKTELGWLL